MPAERIVRRLTFDKWRVRELLSANGLTVPELASKVGMKEKSLYTALSTKTMMPDKLTQIAEALGCSIEYLTGEDTELNRPDKQITCGHCGYCKSYSDASGTRRICSKWHIYRVEESDHCSWGEWRNLREFLR